MHIQERCLLRWVVGLCLLGGVTFLAEAANPEPTTTTPGALGDQETVATIQPLQIDRREETTELKADYPTKEADAKAVAEAKKKPVDFKAKTDQKYQKLPKDEELAKRASNVSAIIKPGMSTLPFLLHGEPMIIDPVATEVPAKVESSSAMAVASTTSPPKDETSSSRGRALNVTAPEPTNSLHANLTDLSDVSMDDDDKEVEGGEYVVTHNETSPTTGTMTATLLPRVEACVEGNRTYAVGDKVLRDCEEKCVCSADGQITNCEPLCVSPYVRRGRVVPDPMCEERMAPEEPCCAVVVCAAADSAAQPEETCVFRNETVSRGQRVEDGCSRICVCEAGGKLECEPRCPPNESIVASQHDRCVALADPRDPCCTIILCDVTLGDHEIKPESSTELTVDPTDAKVLNSTAIKLLKLPVKNPQDVTVELSEDNRVWEQRKPDKDGIISNLMPARTYYMRLTESGRIGPSIRVSLPAEVIKTNVSDKVFNKKGCSHRGKYYELGAEWYDECISFCVCAEPGKPECVTIECPTDFGLDVLDPHCLDWETVPPDFVPKPPQCCPEELRCRNNGSCSYKGQTFDNWSELPSNVTGCEKKCYCDMGNVSCHAACPPVPALPPPNQNCPDHQVSLARIPGDECCLHWVCTGASGGHGSGMDHDLPPPPGFSLPGGLPGYGLGISSDEVVVQILEALDEHTVRLAFTVPQVLVGLHGRVELRYTSDKTNYDPSTWKVQIFAPPGDLIATPQLEFELGDLKPSTEYKVKITVKLKDLVNSPTSKVYSVRTLEKRAESTTLPPQIPIDAELRGIRTNSTWIDVAWKKFTEYELQFIDGIQLRYKEHDGKVYSTTPLIHRAITNYVIENLKPSTTYDLGIYFIPFAGHTTELVSDKTIQVTTGMEPDPYSFEVKVEIKSIKATDVEVSWSGVPYPEDKYVNIYRAIYQTDSGKGDSSTFKIAKRDSPAKTVISDLKPGTRYRLWIEIYLTNGRIKKSNVQDFITKPGVPSQASISQQTGKLASIPIHEGDYYGPLVIVAIVASLAILSTLILLMMLMKRRISSKADISPRKTTSAYDNPSYKTCEETVAIPNGRNKISEHEMATISVDAKINT